MPPPYQGPGAPPRPPSAPTSGPPRGGPLPGSSMSPPGSRSLSPVLDQGRSQGHMSDPSSMRFQENGQAFPARNGSLHDPNAGSPPPPTPPNGMGLPGMGLPGAGFGMPPPGMAPGQFMPPPRGSSANSMMPPRGPPGPPGPPGPSGPSFGPGQLAPFPPPLRQPSPGVPPGMGPGQISEYLRTHFIYVISLVLTVDPGMPPMGPGPPGNFGPPPAGMLRPAPPFAGPPGQFGSPRSSMAPSLAMMPQSRQPEQDHNEADSPPTSPVHNGPTTTAITAQMRCKVFLKQQHQQWKSLGSGKLKLYHTQPTNVKQLAVESDSSSKSLLMSCIVLTDGVERVGKTGVAVEMSDQGQRTGVVYMVQLRNETSAQGLFDSLLAGSDRGAVQRRG